MLGCLVGAKADVKNRKKSEWPLGQSENPPQRKAALKKQQAKIVEACLESGILLDPATRIWTISEIMSLQTSMERCYGYNWSNKRTQPLREMQRLHINMQDISEAAVFSWLTDLEQHHK